MQRRFWFLRSNDLKPYICLELAAYVPSLENNLQFLQSIETFIGSPAYSAYRVDELHPDGSRSRYGGGLIGAYELPFSGEHVFGIEAAWFLDNDPEAHSFVWQTLLNEALDAGFSSLCVSPEATTHPPSMPEPEYRWRDFGVVRNAHTLMRAATSGTWSAFFGTSLRESRFVDCLRVVPRVVIDMKGLSYDGPELLYRGEGRVDAGPYVGCRSLEEVAKRAFKSGFPARGEGAFSGTLPEQIRHQGYIPSPTVSLTASAEVAAHYGTQAGKLERALVFILDPNRLRNAGPIWDSFASLTNSVSGALLQSDFELIIKLVSGLGHLQKAGLVLEGMAEGLRRFAATYNDTLALTSRDYSSFVDPSVWAAALTVLTEDELMQMCSVLEVFLSWHEVPEGISTSNAYVSAFLVVRQELIDALADVNADWRHPGWDATVFGYFAKTCRDKEFFSTGAISGECIREARIVDAQGRILEVLRP